MYPWELARSRSAAGVDEGADEPAVLTEEEIAQLTKIRARYQCNPQCVEYYLNEPRLEFARWLVEHGWLHED